MMITHARTGHFHTLQIISGRSAYGHLLTQAGFTSSVCSCLQLRVPKCSASVSEVQLIECEEPIFTNQHLFHSGGYWPFSGFTNFKVMRSLSPIAV